ncbi:MAG: hypothetical protein IPF54_24630 [Draconibacterium sp.]|nr:hypothetical protein [Draconibacterium sp.]
MILIILLFGLFSSGFIFGQEKKQTVYLKKQNTGWEEFVKKIEQENNVRFFYDADSIPNVSIVVEKIVSSLKKF